MSCQKQLVGIISSIYDTILNPDAWVFAGRRIRERYHSVYSGLYVYDVRSGALVHSALDGADQSFESLYANEFCYIDPYRESEAFMAANPDIPLTDKRIDELFFSIERNHHKHPYFGEYWHRYDCHHVTGTLFNLPGHLRSGICAPRSSSIGAYTTEEKQDFEPIRKAFHQAMTLGKHIHQLGSNTAALEQTIRFINHAVFIVDDKCRILNTNKAGMGHLHENSVLCDKQGRLGSNKKNLNTDLVNAISMACNELINEQTSISRKLSIGPIEILVCPLQKEVNFFKYHNPRAVVFLLQGQVSSAQVLSDIYGLTCTEKQVLRLALADKNIKQISTIRGTSAETIKTQLRHIYHKTEVKNLQQLRALVTPLSALV